MAVVNENSAGSVLALQAEVRRLREELAAVSGGHQLPSSVPIASQSGKFDRLMELEVLLSKCKHISSPSILSSLPHPHC